MTESYRPVVIAIAAHKGGAGKTTTAMALAAGLARFAGAEVLLVDLDPQGHSTMGLGVKVADALVTRTVRELFVEDALPLRELVLPVPGVERLSIVPSTIRLERVAQTLVGRPMRHAVLNRALQPVRDSRAFQFVIIDCPPSLGPLTENALVAADLVIVPCRVEARAVDGLVDLVDMLQLLRPGFDQWRLLHTQRDGRATSTNDAIEQSLEPYAAYAFDTVVPMNTALAQAQIVRKDIFEYDRRSMGAAAYARMVGEVQRWALDLGYISSTRPSLTVAS